MKKDIVPPKVEKVTVAIARKINELNQPEWTAYLINSNDFALENTLVASKGYGEKEGEKQQTSTLRHFLETVEAGTYAQIEPIDPAVFHLTNEYWVSYFAHGQMYDKRFIFLPDTLQEENLSYIKVLELDGVVHS
jgi:hypothetical protein